MRETSNCVFKVNALQLQTSLSPHYLVMQYHQLLSLFLSRTHTNSAKLQIYI